MRTLKDLNEKAWYRFLKVLYFALYLPFIFSLIIGVLDYGREYHPEKLPATIGEALADPAFSILSEKEKARVLKSIDYDFINLPVNEQRSLLIASEFTSITSSLVDRIKRHEKEGYPPQKIIDFLLQSDYTSLMAQIHLAQKKGYTSSEIVQAIKWIPRYTFEPVDYDHLKPVTDPNILAQLNQTTYDPYDKSTWGIPNGFIYTSHYTWQFKKAFYFTALFGIVFLGVMEALKRAFYYVVIGKIFPKD